MVDLQETRKEIDAIDQKIKALYLERMQLSEAVADYKIRTGKKVLDRQREAEKLTVLTAGGLDAQELDAFEKEGIRELFELMMATSRKKQYRLLAVQGIYESSGFEMVDAYGFFGTTVCYQGVEGAYSQAAMKSFFGQEGYTSFHVKSWRAAMDALADGQCDYAVLPIENSTAGAVAENYDLLYEYDFAVIGEEILKIDHCLLGVPGAEVSKIRRVYSHPQALMQCERFFLEHPGVSAERMENTAVSAQKVKVAGDPTHAAIAGKINASLYGLSVLQEAIQDDQKNETRFLVVSRKKTCRKDADTISICFELPNDEGTLYKSLSHFAFNGLNMSRIESRPIEGKNWQYRFFVDFAGNLDDEAVICALEGLRAETAEMKILGNY